MNQEKPKMYSTGGPFPMCLVLKMLDLQKMFNNKQQRLRQYKPMPAVFKILTSRQIPQRYHNKPI